MCVGYICMRDAFRGVLCALALTLAPRDACAATALWGLVLGLSALSATFVGVMTERVGPQSRFERGRRALYGVVTQQAVVALAVARWAPPT